MDLMRLVGLRPKDDTAEALKAALARTESEKAAVDLRIADLERGRGARLLDGPPIEVEKAEQDLAAAQAESSRLGAILPTLRQRIEAAEAAKARGALLSAHDDAVRAHDDFAAWWRAHYAKLAAELARGLAMEANAIEKIERFSAMAGAARMAGAELPETPAFPIKTLWLDRAALAHSGLENYRIGAFVKLPPSDGPGAPYGAAVPFWS